MNTVMWEGRGNKKWFGPIFPPPPFPPNFSHNMVKNIFDDVIIFVKFRLAPASSP